MAPSTCRHCAKEIIRDPGVDRFRSTELDIAIDRMACTVAPDRHHQPAEPEMRRITPQAPPQEPEFRTGDVP